MSFQNPEYLWLLIILIPLTGFFIRYLNQRTKARALAGGQQLNQFLPVVSKTYLLFRYLIFCLLFSISILTLSNPQIESGQILKNSKGADIMICLDISNSMLAEDFKPNRLTMAQHALEQVFLKCEGHRIGLIVFAGEAVKQFALTPDYFSAVSYIQEINTELISRQGTRISEALNLALESIPPSKSNSSAIILITDGEDHDDKALEICETAQKRDIAIHTIGIGTEAGVPIPDFQNGKRVGYKTNSKGETVITHLNMNLLKQIALKTKGICIQSSPSDLGLKQIFKEIDQLDKTNSSKKSFQKYANQYKTFLWLVFVLIFIDILLDLKFKALKRSRVLVLAFCHFNAAAFAQAPKSVYYGNTELHKLKRLNTTDLDPVAFYYKDALKQNPEYIPAQFNLSYIQALKYILNYKQQSSKDSSLQNQSNSALQYLETLSKRVKGKDSLQFIYHNMGTLCIYRKEYNEAIQHLKMALKLNPKDEHTRYNLSYALKQKQKQNKQNSPKSQASSQSSSKTTPPPESTSRQQADNLLKALMSQDKTKQKPKSQSNSNDENDW